MKILIFSVAPWVPTGYGLTCMELTRGLAKKGHQVDIAAYFGMSGTSVEWEGHKVTPVNGAFSLDMKDFLFRIAEGYDLILQHFDTWLLPKAWAMDAPCDVVVYGPVDCENLPDGQKNAVIGTNVVAMSPHGQKAYGRAGIAAHYIPHFVDDEIFKPYPQKECREALGLPLDKFIVGIVGTNRGNRKNIAGMMRAFALADIPDSLLYLHSYMAHDHLNTDGQDLLRLGKLLNIGEKVASTQPMRYIEGLSDHEMCLLFNAFDVLFECSNGEGFGIPILQAAACGVPTIIQNATALPYTAGKSAIVVPQGNAFYQDMLEEWHFLADPNAMAQALTLTHSTFKNDPEKWHRMKNTAYVHAKDFYKDKIITKWEEYLRRITCSE